MHDADADDAAPSSALMLQLARETRSDVKQLLKSASATNVRLSNLERRANAVDKRLAESPPGGRRASVKRDAGLVVGTSTLVVAIAQLISVLRGQPAQAAPTPQPPAAVEAP